MYKMSICVYIGNKSEVFVTVRGLDMSQSSKISRCSHVKSIGDISWDEIKEKQQVRTIKIFCVGPVTV